MAGREKRSKDWNRSSVTKNFDRTTKKNVFSSEGRPDSEIGRKHCGRTILARRGSPGVEIGKAKYIRNPLLRTRILSCPRATFKPSITDKICTTINQGLMQLCTIVTLCTNILRRAQLTKSRSCCQPAIELNAKVCTAKE